MGAAQVDGVVEELATNGTTEGVVEFEKLFLVKGNGAGITFVEQAEDFERLVLNDGLLLGGHFIGKCLSESYI